jgi:hypothetical protein
VPARESTVRLGSSSRAGRSTLRPYTTAVTLNRFLAFTSEDRGSAKALDPRYGLLAPFAFQLAVPARESTGSHGRLIAHWA